MGIPSYFSYIIRKYSNIIQKKLDRVQGLLMDCNSIIYDVYHALKEQHMKEAFDLTDLEDKIIGQTIERICRYIIDISPEKYAYVTFDGVAPFAKMLQQRTRRYKTRFFYDATNIWDTNNITPGTDFMEKLSRVVYEYFEKSAGTFACKVVCSCADEDGEGEHKMFQYLREKGGITDSVVVYGMDADLIMLGLLHVELTENIYVYREMSEGLVILNVKELVKGIKREVVGIDVREYILMCFFLGNDFLPGVVALNIRTRGIDMILTAYREEKVKLIDDRGEIDWKNMDKWLARLATREREALIWESNERDRMEKRQWKEEELVNNAPIIYRMNEKYINVKDDGWCKRYKRRMKVLEVEEYKRGVEWIYKYYRGECEDKLWRYEGVAPLLKELKKEVEIERRESEGYKKEEQLEYVMPKEEKIKLKWEYKRYVWESSIEIVK